MRMRLDPEDDLLHPTDDDPDFNEGRYYSFFAADGGFGGWCRMGNRPYEAHRVRDRLLVNSPGHLAR